MFLQVILEGLGLGGLLALVCVYAINDARGFVQGFWQLLVILSMMNLIDRFWIDVTGWGIRTHGRSPEQRI